MSTRGMGMRSKGRSTFLRVFLEKSWTSARMIKMARVAKERRRVMLVMSSHFMVL